MRNIPKLAANVLSQFFAIYPPACVQEMLQLSTAFAANFGGIRLFLHLRGKPQRVPVKTGRHCKVPTRTHPVPTHDQASRHRILSPLSSTSKHSKHTPQVNAHHRHLPRSFPNFRSRFRHTVKSVEHNARIPLTFATTLCRFCQQSTAVCLPRPIILFSSCRHLRRTAISYKIRLGLRCTPLPLRPPLGTPSPRPMTVGRGSPSPTRPRPLRRTDVAVAVAVANADASFRRNLFPNIRPIL